MGLQHREKSFIRNLRKHTRSIESQEAYTVFKMSDDAVYQDVVDEMHETLMEEGAGYLGELYGLWQVSYSYSEEASLNKFIIYWFYE